MIGELLLAGAIQSRTLEASFQPSRVDLGRTVELVVEVAHPPDRPPRPLEPSLDETSPWVAVDQRREVRPDAGTQGVTALIWTLAPLEPGELAPPALTYRSPGVDLPAPVDLAGLVLTVDGLLAEGEDAPRPMLGLRDLEPVPGDDPWARLRPWILGAAAALALAALGSLVTVLLWLRRWNRLHRPPPREAPAVRLARLREAEIEPRDRRAELNRILRDAVDQRVREDRDGWTDAEWALHLRADTRLSPALRENAARLVAEAERIKYAGEEPNTYALERDLEAAADALRDLAAEEVSA